MGFAYFLSSCTLLVSLVFGIIIVVFGMRFLWFWLWLVWSCTEKQQCIWFTLRWFITIIFWWSRSLSQGEVSDITWRSIDKNGMWAINPHHNSFFELCRAMTKWGYLPTLHLPLYRFQGGTTLMPFMQALGTCVLELAGAVEAVVLSFGVTSHQYTASMIEHCDLAAMHTPPSFLRASNPSSRLKPSHLSSTTRTSILIERLLLTSSWTSPTPEHLRVLSPIVSMSPSFLFQEGQSSLLTNDRKQPVS